MGQLGDPGPLGYPDRLRVAVAGVGGVQDPVTGAWTAAAEQVVYEGAAAIQDTGAVLTRDQEGRLVQAWDAEVFLPPAAEQAGIVPRIRGGQPCTLTWADGTQATAQVVRARRIDAVVEVARLVAVM